MESGKGLGGSDAAPSWLSAGLVGVWVAVSFVAVLGALAVRFLLVEANGTAAACVAKEAPRILCALRDTAIVLFNSQSFGLSALALAVGALIRPSRLLFTLGVATASLGLVLYNTSLSAFAFAILILALARIAP